MVKVFSVYGLETLPLVEEGMDIAEVIIEAAEREQVALENGDIIIVGHKVVSKAEGRVVKVSRMKVGKRAMELAEKYGRTPGFVEAMLKETRDILRVWERTFIIRDWRGLVCVNGGIDVSNVPGEGSYLLLPKNPDASAEKIRNGIQNLTEKRVGVVITDTYSRPLRRGLMDFAVGLAGLKAFEDYRGKRDLYGRILRCKVAARADELAAAAELVLGQGSEGIPVAIVKGLSRLLSNGYSGSNELIMDREEDMYSDVI